MSIEEIVVSHVAWIRAKARHYYDNEEDADDLASETIYKCLSQGSRYDNARSFKPWALTIMENTFKTQYVHRRCVLFCHFEEALDGKCYEYADQRAAVNRLLSIIKEYRKRSCCIECVMLYARGYSYDEISVICGIPIGTVKSRIAAGRRLLRDALE